MIDWVQVKAAVEVSEINEKAAEMLLFDAIGPVEDIENGGATINTPGGAASERVDYGVHSYTDGNDPRKPSASHHSEDADKTPVTVHTLVLRNPETPYYCSSVEAYGPKTQVGGGRTLILVEQPDGNCMVALGTGASEKRGEYDDRIMHSPGQDVVIAGDGVKFTPPNLGGASVFLTNAAGAILSDEVRSMGLPKGAHFVYRLEFRIRKR